MARLVRHRQTKEAETVRPILPPPRHIPTLPTADHLGRSGSGPLAGVKQTETAGKLTFALGSRELEAAAVGSAAEQDEGAAGAGSEAIQVQVCEVGKRHQFDTPATEGQHRRPCPPTTGISTTCALRPGPNAASASPGMAISKATAPP